jgi:hypothetical protein
VQQRQWQGVEGSVTAATWLPQPALPVTVDLFAASNARSVPQCDRDVNAASPLADSEARQHSSSPSAVPARRIVDSRELVAALTTAYWCTGLFPPRMPAFVPGGSTSGGAPLKHFFGADCDANTASRRSDMATAVTASDVTVEVAMDTVTDSESHSDAHKPGSDATDTPAAVAANVGDVNLKDGVEAADSACHSSGVARMSAVRAAFTDVRRIVPSASKAAAALGAGAAATQPHRLRGRFASVVAMFL